MSAGAKAAREYVLRQFCASHVKDEFDFINAIQTQVEFSCAIGATAVVDRIGVWEGEDDQ